MDNLEIRRGGERGNILTFVVEFGDILPFNGGRFWSNLVELQQQSNIMIDKLPGIVLAGPGVSASHV